LVHNFSNREKITFSLLEATLNVKDWWETYCEQRDEKETSLFLATPTWNSFRDVDEEQYYPVRSYEDKYIKWTTLIRKGPRGARVHKYFSYPTHEARYQGL